MIIGLITVSNKDFFIGYWAPVLPFRSRGERVLVGVSEEPMN